VLSEAPDLIDDAALQEGNAAPRIKVHPKPSSQIQRNYLGVTTTRMPRSTESDYLPLEAIHLIDGDLQTCWMSRGQTRPETQPLWIRLDLPVERTVERVVLRKRPPSPQVRSPLGWVPISGAAEVGRGVPATLTIRLSRDGSTWETVFDGPSGDAADKLDLEFRFPARPAKQIWITAGALPLVENILYAFSLAGRNVALATRGTGVTVNSTYHGPGQELAAHRWVLAAALRRGNSHGPAWAITTALAATRPSGLAPVPAIRLKSCHSCRSLVPINRLPEAITGRSSAPPRWGSIACSSSRPVRVRLACRQPNADPKTPPHVETRGQPR
jgi:hypothetical protein